MEEKYEIIKAYQDDFTLRKSFNQLAMEIHGIDFEDWYQNGFWTMDYIPYSVVFDKKVIANVSVSPMTFCFENKEYHLLQLGTVMTDVEFRNKRFIRKLICEIERDFEGKTDGYFLFANDSVLDFYPKFGYRTTKEYFYKKSYNKKSDEKYGNPDYDTTLSNFLDNSKSSLKSQENFDKLIKISALNEADLKKLKTILMNTKENASFALQNNVNLAMFYLIKYMQNDIYYSTKQKAYVIAEMIGLKLHIYSIYSDKNADLSLIVDEFLALFPKTEEVILGFSPFMAEGFEVIEGREEGVTLFTKGELFETFEKNKLRISILSHT